MGILPDTPVSAADLRAVAAHASKSDRMRALAKKGYARARIAEALGVRYQFVRNVLNSDERLARPSPPAPAEGFEETSSPPFSAKSMVIFRLTLDADGALRIPSAVMKALSLDANGLVVSVLEGETFTLLSPFEAGRRAQALIRPWKPGEPLSSDELIAERRAEAARE